MAVKPVPEGFHTVVPYLTVDDASTLINFIEQAFDAKVTYCMKDENGSVRHAEVKIGDSMVMIGQAREEWKSRPGMFVLYVSDCDAVYKKAVAAGGTVVRELATQPYGDRSGGVADSQGNQWWISTHVEDVSPEEVERRMKAGAH
jgi:PhnB protein